MRYVTAKQAQRFLAQGGRVQDGQWIATDKYNNKLFINELSRQINANYRMHPTNKKVSVGKRSAKVWSRGKAGKVVASEPMSAHVALKYMTYEQNMSERKRLRHIAIKANACVAILKEA